MADVAAKERADEKIAKEYGVSAITVYRNAKFAAAVDTLRAVDPDIEAKVVTGKGMLGNDLRKRNAHFERDESEQTDERPLTPPLAS